MAPMSLIRYADCKKREAAFWQLVDRRGPSECWRWRSQRKTGRDSYGRFRVADTTHGAHCVSFVLASKTDLLRARGLHVCHSCDVPACVNPAHLFFGTASDNTRDSIAKGRRPQQQWHADRPSPMRVVSDELLQEALQILPAGNNGRRKGGGLTEFAIKHRLKVSTLQVAVWKARHGRQRSHVS